MIKAWWNRRSRENNLPKTSHEVKPIFCSECGQIKGSKGVGVKPEYINIKKITGSIVVDNNLINKTTASSEFYLKVAN